MDSNNIFFVSLAKSNMAYQIAGTNDIPEKDKGFMLEDVDIEVTGHYSSKDYPLTSGSNV